MTENESGGELPQSSWAPVKEALLGGPRDLRDPSLRHQLSLVAFLAWVGLGADGLSSSAYGPEEAYHALGEYRFLALGLVAATAITVFVISYTYSKIIEQFPQGGGGYVVATELLGPKLGVVSGCALLVDYVLTITVSIAGGGDAVFSLLPLAWHDLKVPMEYAAIVMLIVLNLRGIKESITVLVPIFFAFIITHLILIVGGIALHLGDFSSFLGDVHTDYEAGAAKLGLMGLMVVFLKAYSLGGGTYTGIEAVSNAVADLREPRVATGKRTMLYMSLSLAITAGGLLLCYLLAGVDKVEGRTLNAVLADQWAGGLRLASLPVGSWFVLVTIASEALLLVVAAQTGFIGGPRVMANMAVDSWLPRRFSTLSDRLTMQNGILLIGVAAMGLLAYTRGSIQMLVVMYSLNVFVTFTLAQMGMMRLWNSKRESEPRWLRNLIVHAVGFVLCFAILAVMAVEKFTQGSWVTILITATCIAICFGIRKHYRNVLEKIIEVKQSFADLPEMLEKGQSHSFMAMSSSIKQTAVILVGGYDGLGIHLFLNVLRNFPNTFQNIVFVSVGVVDSAFFKDTKHVEAIEARTAQTLERYVSLAQKLGLESSCEYRIGTDVVEEASRLCLDVSKRHSRCIFFAGELLFEKPSWYQRILHNETAYAIQRQIRFAGLSMVIMPLLLHYQNKSLKEIRAKDAAA